MFAKLRKPQNLMKIKENNSMEKIGLNTQLRVLMVIEEITTRKKTKVRNITGANIAKKITTNSIY